MNKNRLVQNSDETYVLIMASAHNHGKHGNFWISLNTGEDVLNQMYRRWCLVKSCLTIFNDISILEMESRT